MLDYQVSVFTDAFWLCLIVQCRIILLGERGTGSKNKNLIFTSISLPCISSFQTGIICSFQVRSSTPNSWKDMIANMRGGDAKCKWYPIHCKTWYIFDGSHSFETLGRPESDNTDFDEYHLGNSIGDFWWCLRPSYGHLLWTPVYFSSRWLKKLPKSRRYGQSCL